MKTERFAVRHVDEVPRPLEPDTLYVSMSYEVAIHLCACGCGDESVTPFDSGGWALTFVSELPTLNPSILNRRCRAHYFIRNGAVVWA